MDEISIPIPINKLIVIFGKKVSLSYVPYIIISTSGYSVVKQSSFKAEDMHTHRNNINDKEEVVEETSENQSTTKAVNFQNLSDNKKESGVDMAFDALMDLEDNVDLANFMKTHMEGSDELWSLDSHKEVVTNQWTGKILR